MGLLTKLQTSAVRKIYKKNNRHRQFKNIEDIKTVGIIFEYDNETNAIRVQRLATYFRNLNKSVDVIGFKNIKANKETKQYNWLNVLYKNNITIIGKPKTESVTNFMNLHYDVIIKGDYTDAPVIQYICASSKAKLIIGPKDNYSFLYDFIVESSKGLQALYHEQILHYLSLINNNKNT